MFFKVGFFVLLFVVIALVWMFMRVNPMISEGAGSWTEYYSSDPAATIKFLNEAFGIKAETSNTDALGNMEYTTLKAKGQLWPFAGIMNLPEMPDGQKIEPGTMVYLTVKNYDETHRKIVEAGAEVRVNAYVAGGMKFGVYGIPGGVIIGVAQYGVKK